MAPIYKKGGTMTLLLKQPIKYILLASVISIILGTAMILYPCGAMTMMSAAFWIVQLVLSIFIFVYSVSEAIRYFKADIKRSAVFYLIPIFTGV